MAFTKCICLGFVLLATVGSTCSQSEFASPTYELGEHGVLIVRNPSPHGMAIGGCNPSFYEERLPGRWVADPLLRTACGFLILDGQPHLVPEAGFIPPGGSLEIQFPTSWLLQTPGIMRIHQRVSLRCAPAQDAPGYVACVEVEHIVTAPLVIFEPGTTDTVGQRPPGPL